MDFKTLEYYRKIYEKRSIRQAAAELYISPQGLSRTLYALEEELQVRLFERSVKGLEPTRAGDYFYQEAEKLLKSMHQTAFQVRSLYGEEEALRLVCSYGALSALPYSRILEFKRKYPEIHLQWREYLDLQAEQQLVEGDYEIGLLVKGEEPFGDRYESIDLFSRCIRILVYEGHPLYERERLTYQDLKDEPLIMEGNDFRIYEVFRKKCMDAGVYPEIVAETGDIGFCHELCAMKQGLSVTIDFVTEYIRTGGVKALPLEEPEILWTVQLVRHRANRLSPAAEKFFRYLCSEFEEKKENGRSHVKCT